MGSTLTLLKNSTFADLLHGHPFADPSPTPASNKEDTLVTKEDTQEKLADLTHWVVIIIIIIYHFLLLLAVTDESVVYTVMYPALLNEQARNLIWKQPVPVKSIDFTAGTTGGQELHGKNTYTYTREERTQVCRHLKYVHASISSAEVQHKQEEETILQFFRSLPYTKSEWEKDNNGNYYSQQFDNVSQLFLNYWVRPQS